MVKQLYYSTTFITDILTLLKMNFNRYCNCMHVNLSTLARLRTNLACLIKSPNSATGTQAKNKQYFNAEECNSVHSKVLFLHM